jgi:UDP-N-acetylglucosamine 2-epimerase
VSAVGDSPLFNDSGGIQEETTYLEGAGSYIEKHTRRPMTVGTNILVGQYGATLRAELK